MTHRPTRRHLLGSLAAVGLLPLAATAQRARVPVDMGELSPGLGSEANAINNNGRTIGRALKASDLQYRQVVWNDLALTEFDHCCSGFLPTLRAINLSGEVVGDHFATRDDSLPVYWRADGTSFYLPGLSANGFGYANAINDAGQIGGASLDASLDVHGMIWDRNFQFRDIGFLGQPASGFKRLTIVQGINGAGQAVGYGLVGSQDNAFVWRSGTYTNLGPGRATHVNDAGLIAGFAPGFIPVVWKGGVRSNLKALGGGRTAYGHQVNGINAAGDLVGFAPSPANVVRSIAVLWRGGRCQSLGHHPGGDHSVAMDINDRGQVVGIGNLVPGGPMHALRWTV